MSRMLEALKQIQAKSPPTRPAIKPVSLEELELFGLGPSTAPPRPAPLPASPAVQAARPAPAREPIPVCEPGDVPVLPKQIDQPLAHVIVPKKVARASPAPEPGRDAVRPPSPLAEEQREAYRELAEKVLAQLSTSRPAAVMFTSAAEGEGKTSTLASLAVVLAEMVSDEIVALDANFRRPALADHFGICADRGLAEVLGSGGDWHGLVRKTSVRRLSVIPGASFPHHHGFPPENLQLAPVLDWLRHRYPLVLVDTPSLAYPEVAFLSRLCDATYLVIELGRTGRRVARQAVRSIENAGGRVLGCVLTNVPGER